MANIARVRLQEERKQWRLNHPTGFYARPLKLNGKEQIMRWECGIPGKEDTIWAGGLYKLMIEFCEKYPSKPPKCRFTPPLFHPNVYPSGTVCILLLDDDKDWHPSVSVKQILFSIQEMLDNPNFSDPVNGEVYDLFMKSKSAYYSRVKAFAQSYNNIIYGAAATTTVDNAENEMKRWKEKGVCKNVMGQLSKVDAAACFAAFFLNYESNSAVKFSCLKEMIVVAFHKNAIYGESFVEGDEEEKKAIIDVLVTALTKATDSVTLARMRAKKFMRLASQ